VAATYDGAAMRLFLDGTLVGSMPKTGPVARDPDVEAWIGSNPGTFDQVFDGRIDEVRIVGTALTAPEIAQAMTQPLPLPSRGPCGDGQDNDGDGRLDAPPIGNDPGCQTVLSAKEDPQCDDGLDNDADGGRDWDGAGVGDPDPQCVGRPWKDSEASYACGLGHELAFLLPVLRALRMRRGRASRPRRG
jgi:hypothetical protein